MEVSRCLEIKMKEEKTMNKRIITLFAALVLASLSLNAQTWLLEDHRLAFRNNPALAGDTDFISIGEYNSTSRANIGASAFLYPHEGRVVTGLHKSVPAETFLNNLQPLNYSFGQIDYNLVSYGFAKGAAFHTVEVNVRGQYDYALTSDIFHLAKLGTVEPQYSLSGTGAQGNTYAELAYGYTRKLGDVVTLGARAKLLLGLLAGSYQFKRFDLIMTDEAYIAHIDAELGLTNRLNKINPDEDDYLNFLDITAKGKWSGPCGGGLAVDLGIKIEPVENLTIDASILDLGGILWYLGNSGESSGTATFTGLSDITYEEFNEKGLKNQLNEVKDDFLETLRLRTPQSVTRWKTLPFRAQASIKYAMPFYDRLRVGAHAQYQNAGEMSYWLWSGGLGIRPLNWLDLSASLGGGTYGLAMDAAATVRILRFRLTASYHNGFGGTIPYTSTPLQANCKIVSLGLTFDI